MSTKTQVFITGATGYIGGTVLSRLLNHHTFKSSTSEITALVRKADKVPLFKSIGVKTVIGSHEDGALLEKQASLSDVVFACADADHVGACEAILKGLKKRHEATGKAPILIHTSGTGVLTDNAGGMYESDTTWDDMNLEQLDTLPDTQPHRNVDLMVLAADKQGYAHTHIVLPSTIYEVARGKLVDLGIQNSRSMQIPRMVSASITRKRAGMVGEGLNRWPNVHIDDIGDLYIVLYDLILERRAGHGRNGLYFGANGEHVLKDVAGEIGKVLCKIGISKSPEPTSFDDEDYARPENKSLKSLGTNSRCEAKRARELGWKPRHATVDMLKSIEGEIKWQLEHKA